MELSNIISQLLDESFHFEPFEVELSSKVKVISRVPGILEFAPPCPGSTAFVYSCGIHGNETAPIEIMNDLIRDLVSDQLSLQNPLLIIFGHIGGMRKGKRFIEDNLNRMFSDAYLNYPQNKIEAPRAKEIQEAITAFYSKYEGAPRVHYDLHTAIRPSKYQRFAVYPFMGQERKISKQQLGLFAAMGIEAVLFMHKSSPTLSYYSSDVHRADAFTLELGKVEKFGGNKREDFTKAEHVLRQLVSGEKIEFGNEYPALCQVKKELIRHEENYQFNISDDTANFTSYSCGYVIASDSVETYTVQEDGEMIAFPNGKVKVGQRSGLILTSTKLENL